MQEKENLILLKLLKNSKQKSLHLQRMCIYKRISNYIYTSLNFDFQENKKV